MATNRKYKPYPYSFLLGLDNNTNSDSEEIKGTLSVAKNIDLVDEAIGKKRSGYSVVNSTAWGTKRIRGGFEYIPKTGDKQIVVYGEGSTITGTSGVFGLLSSTGVISDIKTDLRDGLKPSFVEIKNLLFCFNGYNDFIYDGSSTYQIGIDAPVDTPTFVANASGGSLNSEGSYVFVYRYYNSVTGARSSPSPASATMTAGSTASTYGIKISVTSGDSSTADQIHVYRTVDGGSVFFFDGYTDIDATTYTSTSSDAGLGNELELDDSRLPEFGKYAAVSDNRVFVAGFDSNKSRVQYSKIGIDGPCPQSFQATDFIDCESEDGDEIIGLNKAGDSIIVLKNKSVGALVPTSTNNVGLERGGSSRYIYRELSKNVTGASHHTMVSYDKYCAWFGIDDIYFTDGNEVDRLGRRIKGFFDNVNFQKVEKFSAVVNVDLKQIIWSVCYGSDSEPRNQIVGHYRYFKDIGLAFTEYTPGTDTSTHPGIIAASMFTVTSQGLPVVYFGSSAADGTVYLLNSGTSDNGYGIYFDVRLHWESLRIAPAKKMFARYDMAVLGKKGASYYIDHNLEVDRRESVVVTQSIQMPGTSDATWGNVTWGNFNWASTSFEPMAFACHKRARYARYGIKNTNANEPVAIMSIIGTIAIDPIGN